MPELEDIRWVKTTANELNNLLQVMIQSSRFLEEQCNQVPDTEKYFTILRTSLDRAAQVTRLMIERTGTVDPSRPATPFPAPGEFANPLTPPVRPPIPTAPGPQAAPGAGEVQIANPNASGELILIVDDENFVTLLAQRVLTDAGYRVVCAKDGFEALDIYKKIGNQIDLIILDFTMPIMDGSEVFNELRMLNPRAPVVLSSGFSEQDKLKWMLAKGLRGFIPKPYSQQKLLLQVRSTLDSLKSEPGR
jgi:CheY-like chemotaxis protein